MKKNNKIKKYVINPLTSDELSSFLDEKSKDIIKYYIIKSLFSQPEAKMGQRQLPIQIPKEHIEQWFTQALNVKPVGAGSFPIDIYNENEKWGADIKMLNIKLDKNGVATNSDSGEASLGQKFEGPGINLDDLFKNKEYEDIKNQWLSLYVEKFNSLNKNLKIKKIFYFFILRPGVQTGGADFYFTGAVIDLNYIKSVVVDSGRTTAKSVFLQNFINPDFGNTKIYKSKKRLELRLKPKVWVEHNYALKIKTSFTSTPVDLRDKKIDSDYLKHEINKLKNIKIDFIN